MRATWLPHPATRADDAVWPGNADLSRQVRDKASGRRIQKRIQLGLRVRTTVPAGLADLRLLRHRDLAILDSLILVSTVLKKFRLDTPDDNDIKATFRMALQPSRPILVTFTPRE
eukprot:scaffold1467_cov264-Pinguiococcus_pyrenoidosus.AAC.15